MTGYISKDEISVPINIRGYCKQPCCFVGVVTGKLTNTKLGTETTVKVTSETFMILQLTKKYHNFKTMNLYNRKQTL
jgi:hypothetical protein